jgi:hypothetical protein
LTWASTQPSRKAAWARCERGDWMLWIAARLGVDRKLVVAAACACARLALPHVPAGEERPRIAIETAEAWCRGEATIEQVRASASSAAASASAYSAYSAAYSYSASASASSAADAVYSASFASSSASSADAASDFSAADASRTETLRQCADICRRMLPMPELPLRKKSAA